MPKLLTAVSLVYDKHAHLTALHHVVDAIDAFLWPHPSWTLESASKCGLVQLFDRLLKNEWPGFDRKCRERRLSQAIQAALLNGYGVQVVSWWFHKYMPGQEVVSMREVYVRAVQYRYLLVLSWIYEETNGDLPDTNDRPYNVYTSSPVVAAWMLDRGDRPPWNRIFLDKRTVSVSFQSIKRCLLYADDENTTCKIHGGHRAIQTGLAGGQLKDLLWLFEHRREFFGPNHLRDAVRNGNLETAKWLVETYPKHYFNNPKRSFDQDVDDLGPSRYNLDMVKWVLCEYTWRKERSQQLDA